MRVCPGDSVSWSCVGVSSGIMRFGDVTQLALSSSYACRVLFCMERNRC